jgi:hypothetical protein
MPASCCELATERIDRKRRSWVMGHGKVKDEGIRSELRTRASPCRITVKNDRSERKKSCGSSYASHKLSPKLKSEAWEAQEFEEKL